MKRRKVNKLFGVASLLALFGVGALLFTNSVEAKEEDSGAKIVVDSPASVKINKVMDNTAGYKPAGDGDKFKFAVTRLSDEEAEKFFPGSKLTPMGESELGTTSDDTDKLGVELDGPFHLGIFYKPIILCNMTALHICNIPGNVLVD